MKTQTKPTGPAHYESVYTKTDLYELETMLWTSTFGRCICLGCYERACDYHGYCEDHES